jgi:UDP-glucose 4-epimerase
VKTIRIVVTGSEGFVGNRVVAALVASGHEVVPFDIRDDSSRSLNDICDLELLTTTLAKAEGVIHLAAISRVAWCEQRSDLCERVNVVGTATLLAAIRAQNPTPWLVFASSRKVYGDPTVLPVHKDATVAPINVYGRSKELGEALVAEACAKADVRSAVIRLSSIYGATDDHHDRVILALLWRALSGEELTITGAASRFDFVHVDDSINGILHAAELLIAGASSVPTVHLATGIGTTLTELAHRAIATERSGSTIRVSPQRRFDVGGFIGDPARAHDVLNWRATISLEQGLSSLCEAMRLRGSPRTTATIPDPAILDRRWKDHF